MFRATYVDLQIIFRRGVLTRGGIDIDADNVLRAGLKQTTCTVAFPGCYIEYPLIPYPF
jgi:hypothetical protein